MNNHFRSAQLASKTVGKNFLLEHWTEPRSIKISEIRGLQDSSTVMNYYLHNQRRQIEAKLLGETHEHQYEVGYLGDHV